ncbi:MAG: nicotinate-nucleotide adenylyltransferase [Proteobacteria bacterium]|nr:nicotinate-nucleotide adenylyltransferase [Pseudomonadota bacterium]
MKKIGIFGGTFDPVHLAHLRAAEEFAENLGLDRILMIVSGVPPHRARPSASAAQRFEMLRLAVEGNPLLEISDMELKREGPHYTLDTVRQVREMSGGSMPFLALGVDAFLEIATWHKPEEVLAQTHLVILTRPGFETDLLSPVPSPAREEYRAVERAVFLHRSGATLRMVEITPLDISSSLIRELAAQGRSFRYLVPEPVFDYIRAKDIYRS